MANLSELTRKQQVLVYLQARTGLWVDGPELANEQVGGSEGLKRLRELRQDDGYDIRARKHPDPNRDIWQYRLVPGRLTPEQRAAGNTMWTNGASTPQVQLPAESAVQYTIQSRAPEPAEKPVYPKPEPPKPQTPISTAIKRKEDGTYEYVRPQRTIDAPEQLTTPADPPQPAYLKFDRMPTKVVYGEVAICPRCHSKTTRGRPPKPVDEETRRKREMMQRRRKANAEDESQRLVDEDGILLFRDPHSRKPKPCEGCNGYGIVPNQGPIPLTSP